jgi:hypothetical protein
MIVKSHHFQIFVGPARMRLAWQIFIKDVQFWLRVAIVYCLTRGEKPSPSGEDFSIHTECRSLRLATEFFRFPLVRISVLVVFLQLTLVSGESTGL